MTTPDDNFEFAVSQAVDGVLGEGDRRTLGDRLATPDGQGFAAEHGRVNAFLRAHAERPAVDFDAFADRFTAALGAEDAYAPAPLPIRAPWVRRLAVAAAVVLAALAAWPFLPHRAGPGGQAIVEVDEPAAPTTAPVIDVRVGPSETMIHRGLVLGLDTTPRPAATPKVVISAVAPAADARPY